MAEEPMLAEEASSKQMSPGDESSSSLSSSSSLTGSPGSALSNSDVSATAAPAAAAASPGATGGAVSRLTLPEHEGYLTKRGEKRRNWKRRYFVLKDNELKYYHTHESFLAGDEAAGVVPLQGCTVEFVPEEKYKKKFCFEISSPNTVRVYILVADNGTEMQEWMNAVRRAMLSIRRAQNMTQRPSRASISRPIETSDDENRGSSERASFLRSEHTVPSTNHNSEGTPGGPSGSAEENYPYYLDWLEEKKQKEPVYRGSQVSHLHHRLLDDAEAENASCWSSCSSCSSCAIM